MQVFKVPKVLLGHKVLLEFRGHKVLLVLKGHKVLWVLKVLLEFREIKGHKVL